MKKVCLLLLLNCFLLWPPVWGQDQLAIASNIKQSDSLRIEALIALGDSIGNTVIDSAIKSYEKAILLCEKNNKNTLSCRLLSKSVMLYYRAGNLEKAVEYSNRLIQFAEKHHVNNYRLRGYNYSNFFLLSLSKYKESLVPAFYGIALCDSLGDTAAMGTFYNRLGAAYEGLTDYPNALTYYQKAQNSADAMNDSILLAKSYNNIGNIMDELGKPLLQLEYYQKALKIRQAKNDKPKIASLLENIGIVYLQLEQYSDAIDNFRETLSMREELGDESGKTQTLINIGTAHEGLGNLNQALGNYIRAMNRMDDNENTSLKSKCLANISDIYYAKGEFRKASEYALQSLAMAEKTGDRDDLRQSYEYLVKIFDTTRQYKRALDYYKLYTKVKDSISGTEISKQLQELETKYQTEQKEQQIELANVKLGTQELRLKQQELQKYALIIGLAMVLIIALIVLRGYRQKKKANELLGKQKKEIENKNKDLELANVEITGQKNIIEEKNVKIIDSIRYARRIQQTILPSQELINKYLPDSFVLYKPKDIVSGDFYWLALPEKHPGVLFSAIDCTGHGVPGAFVSIVGHNSINRVVKEFGISRPAAILDKLNELVVKSFSRQKDHEVKDGMDMALCLLDCENKTLEYAGANNPLYLIRNGELIITKADKQPIGAFENRKFFTNHHFDLLPDDVIYIFSDGYIDQFGGSRGKKFMSRRFRDMLLEIHKKPMPEQKTILNNTITEWMGAEEQVDDILVIGVKI